MPTAKKRTSKPPEKAALLLAENKTDGKTLGLSELREQIETLVKCRAVSMVQTTIDEAGKGHFPAMKYLFEMIGLYPGPVAESQEQDSLAKTLLRHLGLPENPISQDFMSKVPDVNIPSAIDTVK